MRHLGLALSLVLLALPVRADYPVITQEDGFMTAARGQINRGEFRGAVRILERLVSTRPEDADVLSMLGFAHRLLGEEATSRRYYARALTADPDHLPALSYAGMLELGAGDLDAARAHLARLVALCPAGCEARSNLEAAFAEAGV